MTEVIADKGRLREWLAGRGLAEPPSGIFDIRLPAAGLRQGARRLHNGVQLLHYPSGRLNMSRAVPEILDEVGRLVAFGHREIVLTGIHLGHFGVGPCAVPPFGGIPPKGGTTNRALPDLLRQIAALPGEFRLRLSSLEAAEVTDDLWL